MSIYLDNGATSWPKPASVLRAMENYFKHGGGNPGRSGHKKAVEAGRAVLGARIAAAELFHLKDPSRVIFTKNATEALNMVLFGYLQEGDHFITTSMEHNSVLRPAAELTVRGVEVTIVEADAEGSVDPESIAAAFKPNTKLVAVSHGSNVTGTVQDIESIASLCRKKGAAFLVDAAQTAGVVPVDMQSIAVDFLAVSGHKGLLGPQGTGCLLLGGDPGQRKDIRPLLFGGTGSLSDKEIQPGFLPDALESGTLNTIGIVGLRAGIEFILRKGIDTVYSHDHRLYELFTEHLGKIPGIEIYGPENPKRHTGVLSVTIEGLSPSKAGELLDKRFGICTRIGLHCAPRAHKTIGTFPDGTVRFGWGPFTREADILRTVKALKKIVSLKGSF